MSRIQCTCELLGAFARAGGSVNGEVAFGAAPDGLEPVSVRRRSRRLAGILHSLLAGSNNDVANQAFLEIGAPRLGGGRDRRPSSADSRTTTSPTSGTENP